jgi:hypothetical protein
MQRRLAGYNAAMGIINRIMTLVTAPFRAIAALFGGNGRRGNGRRGNGRRV